MNIVETMSTFVQMKVASFHASQWSLSKLQKKKRDTIMSLFQERKEGKSRKSRPV
jgi:hypothetical protein